MGERNKASGLLLLCVLAVTGLVWGLFLPQGGLESGRVIDATANGRSWSSSVRNVANEIFTNWSFRSLKSIVVSNASLDPQSDLSLLFLGSGTE